jgi:hypothetical protein
MNAEILAEGNLVVNRFFALDGRAYEAARSTCAPRSCSASSPRWCFGATTASPTT